MTPHILNLFSAYTANEISEKQFNDLHEWLNENSENKQMFSNYLYFYKKLRRINFAQSLDKEKAWSNIVSQLDRPLKYTTDSKTMTSKVKYQKSLPRILKYVATVIVFLGVGYLYQSGYFSRGSAITAPSENITLQLENGNIEIINVDGSSQVVDAQGNVVGTQNGNQIVYTNKVDKETLVYNTLTVPYGKRFEVQLSDGTVINLNAGTSLKYPVKFIQGENRQVFLDGEAYFNVTKDESHPFVVNTDEVNVRVLGTQFNISSYPEDEQITTVLVEGAVSIYDKDDIVYNHETATILNPGFKASWRKENNQINIEDADIEMHTAWLHGKIIFRHTTFNNIIKKLERHYNVVIINKNEALGNERFAASFDIETIDEVFKSFNEIYSIDYTINENQIIIN